MLKYSVFRIMAHTHHMEANRNIESILLLQQVFKWKMLSKFTEWTLIVVLFFFFTDYVENNKSESLISWSVELPLCKKTVIKNLQIPNTVL